MTAKVISQVSSVSGYVQVYPQISQRQATTIASVLDGTASIIIGGLIQDAELRSLSKVPGGDLPIIGHLFRRSSMTMSRVDLYIVITPRIVRHNGTASTAAK